MMLKTIISSILVGLIHYQTMAQQAPISGKDLFQKNCAHCHGADGTRRFLGAPNLQKSTLDGARITTIIQNGKRFMPSFKNKLTEEEIKELTAFLKTLRP
jgi:cytochrome c6